MADVILSALIAPTLAFTGDATGSGTSSIALTIPAGTITLAKMANMATASFIGRNTAATGVPEVLSVSTVRTMLSISNVENTALSTWAGSANITSLGTVATGTWNATTIAVDKGGTGRATSTTAYGLLAAGTTATGAHQTLAAGLTTQILVGGGASALPVWTTATGTGAPVREGSPTFTGTVSGQNFALTPTLGLGLRVEGGLTSIEQMNSRVGDTNSTFQGRYGAAFRISLAANNIVAQTCGMYAFGGQWGTDTTYTPAKVLYPASVCGMAEGAFTAAAAMPMGLSFRTGSTGQDLTAANQTYGTERLRISSTGDATFTGTIITAASIAGSAYFRLPHGTAPTTPTNGDLWTTTAGLYARINGSTVGPYGAGGGSTPTGTGFYRVTAGVMDAAAVGETGTGNVMRGIVPTLAHTGGTGAGIWFDGITTSQRVFIGMAPAAETTWRIYSAPLAADMLTFTLATGAATFASSVTSSQNFTSSVGAVVLATTGAGTVYLRPNGAGSGTGQMTVDNSGNILGTGNVTSPGTFTSSQTFASSSVNAVLSTVSAGTVYLRPNGAGTTNGQFYVDSNGNANATPGSVTTNPVIIQATGPSASYCGFLASAIGSNFAYYFAYQGGVEQFRLTGNASSLGIGTGSSGTTRLTIDGTTGMTQATGDYVRSAYSEMRGSSGNAWARFSHAYYGTTDHLSISDNFKRTGAATGTIDSASLGTTEILCIPTNAGPGTIAMRVGAVNTAPSTIGTFSSTGLAVTGNVSASGTVLSGQNFTSSGATSVLATTGAGTVFLRPNGSGSTTGQFYVDSTGFGLFNSNGSVGTQVVSNGWAWGDGVPRWKTVLEANASFSFWGYNTGGISPTRCFNFATSVAGGSQLMTIDGQVDAAGAYRVTGDSTFASNVQGMEMYINATNGWLLSYNRGAATYHPMKIAASTIEMRSGVTVIGTFSSTGLAVTGNVSLGDSKTTSSLIVGAFGHIIGRNSADGALWVGGGQATIELKNPTNVTGAFTATNNITSSQNFISSSGAVVVAPTGAGSVYLRPQGSGSATNEMYLSSTGNATFNGPNCIVESRGSAGFGAFYAIGSGTNASYYFLGSVTTGEYVRLQGTSDTLTIATGTGAVTRATINTAGLTVVGTVTDSLGNLRITNVTNTTGGGNLTLANGSTAIRKSNSTAQTWTIPPNSSVAYPIGTMMTFHNAGGTTLNLTVARGAGVLIYHQSATSADVVLTPGQSMTLQKTDTDTWQG